MIQLSNKSSICNHYKKPSKARAKYPTHQISRETKYRLDLNHNLLIILANNQIKNNNKSQLNLISKDSQDHTRIMQLNLPLNISLTLNSPPRFLIQTIGILNYQLYKNSLKSFHEMI